MPSKMIKTDEIVNALSAIGIGAGGLEYSEWFKLYCHEFQKRHGKFPKIMIGTPFNLPRRLSRDNWSQIRRNTGDCLGILGFEEGKKEKWLLVCADDGIFSTSTPYVVRPQGHLVKFKCKIEAIQQPVKAKAPATKPPATPATPEPPKPKFDVHAALAKLRQERAKDALI